MNTMHINDFVEDYKHMIDEFMKSWLEAHSHFPEEFPLKTTKLLWIEEIMAFAECYFGLIPGNISNCKLYKVIDKYPVIEKY